MFNSYRAVQHKVYQAARNHFLSNPEVLIGLEKFFAEFLVHILKAHLDEIVRDYDETNYLYPFWQNYPPDERGRQPIGDQFPWIEVGEHAIGTKFARFVSGYFSSVRDTGLPTGADERFVISDDRIKKITGITNTAWLFIDIKSVGPRDDADHTVMSHNQISGDGIWEKPDEGVRNTILKASGQRASHDFHCSVPPLYVLSDGSVAPVIMLALKPTYRMLALVAGETRKGQPLARMTVVSIPNGLLLIKNPAYLNKYPGLLFPGKDDKGKDPRKVRARVSFDILRRIAEWRVQVISVPPQANSTAVGMFV
jgi:hypothetical protein